MVVSSAEIYFNFTPGDVPSPWGISPRNFLSNIFLYRQNDKVVYDYIGWCGLFFSSPAAGDSFCEGRKGLFLRASKKVGLSRKWNDPLDVFSLSSRARTRWHIKHYLDQTCELKIALIYFVIMCYATRNNIESLLLLHFKSYLQNTYV